MIVKLDKDDPLIEMADKSGWVLEHRLIIARKIGRPLYSDEVVHHINGIKSDNREDNLRLLVEAKHNSHLAVSDVQTRLQEIEARLTLVEAENTLLQAQLGAMLIPSQAEDEQSSGVCRDLTGDTPIGGEEKVHSSRKLGGKNA